MILRTIHTRSFREHVLNKAAWIELHPILLLKEIVSCRAADVIFTYSRYEVAEPGHQASARRSAVLRVDSRDITPDWLADRFGELAPNEEMAWHSFVECGGVGFHIPMIDFVNKPAQALRVGHILAADLGLSERFFIFETGRSLHGYFADLISEQAWPKYLGRLLVINEQDRPAVIDARWVGHALWRGFAALRWSHNTDRYLALPRLTSPHPRPAV
jgi:hypothetical protein